MDNTNTHPAFYIIMADDHETRFKEGFDYRFKRFPGSDEGMRQAQHAADELANRYKKKFHVLGCLVTLAPTPKE